MVKIRIGAILFVAISAAAASAGETLPLSSDISFQKDPYSGPGTEIFATRDDTARMASLDAIWAPGPSYLGTPGIDYYAGGGSLTYWDAVSLSFDLSPIDCECIASVELHFYLQQGSYSDQSWHHYEVLPGAFNPTHEDDPPPATAIDFGAHGPDGTVGWLTVPIPLEWMDGDGLELTVRLWNARVDQVEIWVQAVPAPGAILLGIFGAGFVVLSRRSCTTSHQCRKTERHRGGQHEQHACRASCHT